MTKKNYVAIARIFKEAKKKAKNPDEIEWIQELLADYFRQDNPRFNKQTFDNACDPT